MASPSPDLLSDDDRALLDTLGGGPASGDVLKRRGELQRSLEAHVRQMQMKYEVLNPSVELLNDIRSQHIDMRMLPTRVRTALPVAPSKSFPVSVRVKQLLGNTPSAFGAPQPELKLPLPLPSPSPAFASPFETAEKVLTFGGTGGRAPSMSPSARSGQSSRFVDADSIDDRDIDALVDRALQDSHPFAGSNETSDAASREKQQRLRGAPAPRFRSAPDPAFASVRLTAHLASSIPTTDTERVNLSNWTSAGLDAAPPPGPSFGNPPDLSEKAWIAARDKDNNAAALLLEEAKKNVLGHAMPMDGYSARSGKQEHDYVPGPGSYAPNFAAVAPKVPTLKLAAMSSRTEPPLPVSGEPGQYAVSARVTRRGVRAVVGAPISQTARFPDLERDYQLRKEEENSEEMNAWIDAELQREQVAQRLQAEGASKQAIAAALQEPKHRKPRDIIERNTLCAQYTPAQLEMNVTLRSAQREVRIQQAHERAASREREKLHAFALKSIATLNKRTSDHLAKQRLLTDLGLTEFAAAESAQQKPVEKKPVSSVAVDSSLDRILENPRLATIFRWQRWMGIIACMTRFEALKEAYLMGRLRRLENRVMERAVILIQTSFRKFQKEKIFRRAYAVLRRAFRVCFFHRRMAKKRRATQVISGFFFNIRHEKNKNLIWLVQRYRAGVIHLQRLWRDIYLPKYLAECAITLKVWEHITELRRRQEAQHRTSSISSLFHQSAPAQPAQQQLPPPPPTQQQPQPPSGMAPPRMARRTSMLGGATVAGVDKPGHAPNNTFEMRGIQRPIEFDISPNDYADDDRAEVVRLVRRARKREFFAAVAKHKAALDEYVVSQSTGMTAAKRLLSSSKSAAEITNSKALRRAYLVDHPWPRWRPMPTPAELIRHIRRVAQKLRPVKHLQHENAMGIGLEAALGGLNHSSAALARSSSIVGGLTSVWAALAMLSAAGVNVTDLASVNKAVASGMSLPPGVSPDLVVSIASSMGSKPAGPAAGAPPPRLGRKASTLAGGTSMDPAAASQAGMQRSGSMVARPTLPLPPMGTQSRAGSIVMSPINMGRSGSVSMGGRTGSISTSFPQAIPRGVVSTISSRAGSVSMELPPMVPRTGSISMPSGTITRAGSMSMIMPTVVSRSGSLPGFNALAIGVSIGGESGMPLPALVPLPLPTLPPPSS